MPSRYAGARHGAAVGQNPDLIEKVTYWCKKHYSKPVIVKLTPNITDIRVGAQAALRVVPMRSR
ncbi:hypothetical protein HORIV_61300 [Vreelandella olivaria]|uniref:dihydrouracil dehydrogenase (NAD(+)) n=1 Tax=Vreelandella olivaria TaxID=390919 RepID=A0ABM7GSN8_9GAMM|nr:hypothetical protein HORIV_61300 [Halomonas olivaria]